MHRRQTSTRVRTACRIAAVSLVGLAAIFLFLAYLEARANGNWNHQANLWMSLGTAGVGALGWFFPRIIGWVTLPLAALWLLWALAWEGGLTVAALVVGGTPLATSLLFVFSGRSRHATESPVA